MDLPKFVIAGYYDDVPWREAAAKPAHLRTPDDIAAIMRGPRPHPYGAAAYSVELPDKRTAIYPSREDYEKAVGNAPAQNALDQINGALLAKQPAPDATT